MRKTLVIILIVLLTKVHAQNLFVGANFHPHDYDTEQEIDAQIAMMKQAGFNVVRLGHLAWDSFESSDAKFTLEWLDKTMDKMAKANIRVILDIPVRPAPMWVHQKCPGTKIVSIEGDTLQPLHRYYEDVGDPGYQHYAYRLAEVVSARYAHHPALMAYGIDNEPGDGAISYAETVRRRFIGWLKKKYKDVEELNQAWAGWRWSRKVNYFEEVILPDLANVNYGGNAERQLDFRRFLSDEILAFYSGMIQKVNEQAPGIPTFTNAWYYSNKYYDYAQLAYNNLMTHGGCGFYPGSSLDSYYGIRGASFGIQRIQYEQNTPHWCAEFTTDRAAPQAMRKQAYMSLMYGNQMVCGWTWQTMWAGEEQYLQGMVDWDGTPNYKYEEYKQIATEFSKIQKWFPYHPNYQIGLALDFTSVILGRMCGYPVTAHENQAQSCFDWFFDHNMDVQVVDPNRSDLPHKLLILPGMTYISPETAQKVRQYIAKGGTVIMTTRSAMTDSSGQVMKCTQPAYLDDVFGIRLGGILENQEQKKFDEIDLRGAEMLRTTDFYGKTTPLVTRKKYGKGEAIYVGESAGQEVVAEVIAQAVNQLGIPSGPQVPEHVSARWIDEHHLLLLNHTSEDKVITVNGTAQSLLTGKYYTHEVMLKANDADFLEIK